MWKICWCGICNKLPAQSDWEEARNYSKMYETVLIIVGYKIWIMIIKIWNYSSTRTLTRKRIQWGPIVHTTLGERKAKNSGFVEKCFLIVNLIVLLSDCRIYVYLYSLTLLLGIPFFCFGYLVILNYLADSISLLAIFVYVWVILSFYLHESLNLE